MTNRLELSEDRMELKIRGPGGRLVTARSRRPEGFIAADLKYAAGYRFPPELARGQVNTIRRIPVGSKAIYVQIGTGPPTWRIPRLRIRKVGFMAGWLRGMIAVAVKDEATRP